MRPYLGFRHRGRLQPHMRGGAPRGAIRRAIAGQAPGSVRLKGRHAGFQWQLGLALLEGRPKRSDGAGSFDRYAADLAGDIDPRSGTVLSLRARRCARTGLSVRTWQRCRRRAKDAGALVTVYEGCRRYDDLGNVRYDVAVDVPCLPRHIVRKIAAARRAASPRPLTVTPRSSGEGLQTDPLVVTPGENRRGPPCGRTRQLARPPAAAGAAAGQPRRRPSGRLHGAGQGGASRRVRALWRIFDLAGYTAADKIWAETHFPGGRERGNSDPVRAPVWLLRRRLMDWLVPADAGAVHAGLLPWHRARPLPPPSWHAAAAAAAQRERQAAERAAGEAAAARRAADPDGARQAAIARAWAAVRAAQRRPRLGQSGPESGNDQEARDDDPLGV